MRDMGGYTKLFNSILASTVWETPLHVRVVWVSLLAMCDQHGEVHASVPGLAKIAGVTRAQAIEAVDMLSAPDPDSRTKEHEGRRIAPIDGGWEVLNYAKYRHKQSEDEQRAQAAERQRRKRARDAVSRSVTESHGGHDKQKEKQREEAEEERADPSPPAPVSAGADPPGALSLPGTEEPAEAPSTAIARRVFAHWQQACGKSATRVTPKRLALIRGRLREGFTEAELRQAATNVGASAWHRGENERGQTYLDLELVYRDAAHVEKYRDMVPRTDAPGGPSEYVRLSAEYRAAKERGDADEVARLKPLVHAAFEARKAAAE